MSYYQTPIRPDELYHYGVLGMKWGVRKDREPTGRHRTKRTYITGSASKKLDNKQTHRDKLMSKYLSKGMSQKEAEAALAKRLKTEKIIRASAAVTLVAAGAYLAYNKYGKEFCDTKLKSGLEFHSIYKSDINPYPNNPFYAAYTDRDRAIYKGLHGYDIRLRKKHNPFETVKEVFDVNRKLIKDIKVPSHNKAASVFTNLIKSDDKFAQNVIKSLKEWDALEGGLDKQGRLIRKALNEKTSYKTMYDAFNLMLVDKSETMNSAKETFFSKLKDLGYSGIFDMNDIKYSGYNAKNPIIIFDLKSVVQQSIDKLSFDNVASYRDKRKYYVYTEPMIADYLKTFGESVVVTTALGGVSVAADKVYKKGVDSIYVNKSVSKRKR